MWKNNWLQFLEVLKKTPSILEANTILDPASEDSLLVIERKFGITIPPLFKSFFLNSSGGIDIGWSFAEGTEIQLQGEGESINYGGLFISVDEIARMNFPYQYNDPDEYDLEYHTKNVLAFAQVANGDQFAVVLSGPDIDCIKYLSHDLDDIHLYTVGKDINAFLSHYARVGFVGPEYWVWEQFTNQHTTTLDAESAKALEFLTALQKLGCSSELTEKGQGMKTLLRPSPFSSQKVEEVNDPTKIQCDIPGVFHHDVLGNLVFADWCQAWVAEQSDISIIGIPGDEMSIDKGSLDFVVDKVRNIKKYIEYCSEDLLSIASKYPSLPKGVPVNELYQEPSLDLDDDFWIISFFTYPKYQQWLSIVITFEGENIVLIEVDDNDEAFEIRK